MLQSKWVHVYDTKAFHAIFIKEQDNYEEDGLYVFTRPTLGGDGMYMRMTVCHSMLRIMLGPGLLGTLGEI